jgi:pimeloyl-ACP methyl ester carboxylesterase
MVAPATTPRWIVSLVLRRIYGAWAVDGTRPARVLDAFGRSHGRRESTLQSVREFDFTPRDPKSLKLGDCQLVLRFGELDRLIPHHAAVLHAQRFQGADIAVIEGVGHVPAEEVAEEVAALIQRVASEVARG